ncbi:hypothetical protein [Spirosoma pulveris]
MESTESQSIIGRNIKLIEIVKRNLNAIRSEIDWSQVEFEKDCAGNIVRLRSNDPMLCEWLQQTITITRPESDESAVAYPNVFVHE